MSAAEPFVYEGDVTLLCQEGGYADYGIGLDETGASLADALCGFATAKPGRLGDVPLGRLRITVERAP